MISRYDFRRPGARRKGEGKSGAGRLYIALFNWILDVPGKSERGEKEKKGRRVATADDY